MPDKDKNEDKKMNLPPLPPGFPKPGGAQPPLPSAGRPVPPLPGAVPAFPFAPAPVVPAPNGPARDAAAEEAVRNREDKEKLEKKIAEMEKSLSQEKEKALLATLKSQQDEVLSSKVESSLKDIQDKLRRDRHEQEVAEERLTLKARIKELESKLVQERETWMQTLQSQMQERDSSSKDVEGHFLIRLQEMERRWLEEKAQWQKTYVQKEEEVRSLKHSAERLREVQDELRLSVMDKAMLEKEAAKLKEEVARADRDKAAAEAYIRNIPEKERELANLRAELSIAKMREEKVYSDFKTREDKLTAEIDRLQRDIGTVAERKNSEKEEELKKLQARYEATIQEKENSVALVTGEKIRAVSELARMKSFVAKFQAVNAALEKERAALRVEKMQMAQVMAANMEEARKIKQELDHFKAAHQNEIDELVKKQQAQLERLKETYAGEITRECNEKLLLAQKERHEETFAVKRKYQEELSRQSSAHQEELSKVRMQAQSDIESRIIEIRSKYESGLDEVKNELKRQFAREYADEISKLENAKTQAVNSAAGMELEVRRLSEELANYKALLSRQQKEAETAGTSLAESRKNFEEQLKTLSAMKADYEKRFSEMNAEGTRLAGEHAALTARFAALTAEKGVTEAEIARLNRELKAESENRARFEAELLFLKNKVQQMEYQEQDLLRQIEAERQAAADAGAAAALEVQAAGSKIAELSEEIEKYKSVESTLSGRLKWALKGKQD